MFFEYILLRNGSFTIMGVHNYQKQLCLVLFTIGGCVELTVKVGTSGDLCALKEAKLAER